MKLLSPAKINLYFRVLRKRPDGYHDIESLYQAIDLFDEIEIEKITGDRDELICDHKHVPKDETNLILKAAKLFREKAGLSQKFSFKLHKTIPMQAGLGGGSSNAATTLWGLNQLMDARMSDATLASLGAELGSDVAFFFSNGRAECEGRGERLNAVHNTPKSTVWIAKPKDLGLSTAQVYQHTNAHLLKPPSTPYFNDLEVAAFGLLPQLKKMKKEIKQLGFDEVHMTGSGTAFYCLGEPKSLEVPGIKLLRSNFLYREPKTWYKRGNPL